MRRTDLAHLVLMLGAAGLAYAMPFELLALAYAVLGPAHYTTEISWLHDRKFFLRSRWFALPLAGLAVYACFLSDPGWFGLLMWGAFAGCVLLAASGAGQASFLLLAATGLTVLAWARVPALGAAALLLPTVIHVCLFTLIFMVLGACRARSAAQAVLVMVYLSLIGLILLAPPSPATVVPQFAMASQTYFGNVAPALARLLGMNGLSLDARLTGFLSFIYTYHYLNWFIKAEVIRWADIPRRRWVLIAGTSAASTGLYFYDYALGFSVLLVLSVMHVLLEFPLNALAVRQLGGMIFVGGGRARPMRHAPPPVRA